MVQHLENLVHQSGGEGAGASEAPVAEVAPAGPRLPLLEVAEGLGGDPAGHGGRGEEPGWDGLHGGGAPEPQAHQHLGGQ